MDKIVRVNSDEYEIVRLLGHGKGGYSYLALSKGKEVVLKQIHHEPCEYYAFGNKIEAEKNDYRRLKDAGIRIPPLMKTLRGLLKNTSRAQPFLIWYATKYRSSPILRRCVKWRMPQRKQV